MSLEKIMEEIPACPPELNQKVFEMMERTGQNNMLCADYFTDFAYECLDSRIKYFKKPLHVPRDLANQIAARLVMEYLQKKDLVRAFNVVMKEGRSDMFSDMNDADIDALQLNPRIPPIKKLMRQRYAIPEESEGWFNIDSQVDDTIDIDEEGGSTFSVATILEKVERKNARESLIGYARPRQQKRPKYTCNFSVASKSLSNRSGANQNKSNDSRNIDPSSPVTVKSDTKSRKSRQSKK